MHDDEPQERPSLGGRDLIALGGLLVAGVVAGLVLGLLADAWLGTSPALVLAGIALGIVAGGAGFWLRIRSYLR